MALHTSPIADNRKIQIEVGALENNAMLLELQMNVGGNYAVGWRQCKILALKMRDEMKIEDVAVSLWRQGNTQIWFDPNWMDDQLTDCFEIDYWQKRQRIIGSAQGRGTTWFVQTAKLPAALRHYRRGGLLGKLVADSYLFTGWDHTRAAQEFKLLAYLHQQGLAVPRPLAARAVRHGMVYRADLLVEKIEHAKDLVAILGEQSLSAEKYQQIGQLVKKMHALGVCHSDLNIHNILLDNSGKFWLIDFDKCDKRSGENWQAANLARLQRSFYKEKERAAINWQLSDWDALIAGYACGK